MRKNCRVRRPRRTAKQALSIILSLAMLLSLTAGLDFSAYAATPSSGSCGVNVYYNFNSTTGLLTIKGSGEMKNYYSGSNSPFRSATDIKAIVIESGVTSVGNYAFFDCKSITNATIADSVVKIGSYAFSQCDELASVDMSQYVTVLGERAFAYSKKLSDIELPQSVVTIGKEAFEQCTSLTKIIIPEGVTKISDSAFNCCKSLNTVTMGDGVTEIGKSAFNSCTSLVNINLPDSITTLGSSSFRGVKFTNLIIPSKITEIPDSCFSSCSSLTSITIPNGVTSIGKYAFSGCSGVETINLSDSVTTISEGAFSYCSSLKNISLSKYIESLTEGPFYGCTKLTSINVDSSNPYYCSIGGNLYNKNRDTLIQYAVGKSNTSFSISENVKTIGGYAFNQCEKLESITIPSSVKTIGKCAFQFCSGIESISIPDSVTFIGDNAFQRCTRLKSIKLPKELTAISGYCFCVCSSLESIDIPETVTSIGGSAFYNCTDLKSIKLPNQLTTIGSFAFDSCTGLKSIELPSSIRDVVDSAFFSCGNLEYVIINEGATKINPNSFKYCNKLKNIYYTGNENAWKSVFNSSYSSENPFEDIKIHYNYSLIVDEAVEATCTTDGHSKLLICSECGEYIEEPIITPAFGHTVVIDEAVSRTCTQTGLTEGSHCSACGETIVAQEVVEARGHDYILLSKQAPSCSQSGSETYICRYCYDQYNIELPKKEHTVINDEAVAPTCTATGLTEGSHCSVCGKVLVEQTVIPAKGHTIVVDKAIPATCAAEGLSEGSHCSVCGEVLAEQHILPKAAHSFNSGVITTAPTCTESGIKTYTCIVCKASYEEELESIGHNYEPVVTQPTCTEQGYTTYTCLNCKDSYIADYVDELGHSFSTFERYCLNNCGSENPDYKSPFINEAEITGVSDVEHTGEDIVFDDLTVVLNGEELIENTNYTVEYNNNKNIGTATVTITGKGDYRESVEKKFKILPVKNNIESISNGNKRFDVFYSEGEAEASVYELQISSTLDFESPQTIRKSPEDERCIRIIVNKITEDKQYYVRTRYAVTAQDSKEYYSNWSPIAIAEPYVCKHESYTITQADDDVYCVGGIIDAVCDRCEESLEIAVEGKGHDIVIDEAEPATCTKNGKTEGAHCSVCKKVLKQQSVINKLGHNKGDAAVENLISPTCTEDGSYDSVIYCTRCNEELSRNSVVMTATGHNYVATVTEPTCKSEGYTTYTCTKCNDKHYSDFVSKLEHSEVIDNAIVPTCTETGLTEGSHCFVCNEVIVKQIVVPALGHNWDSGKVTKKATPTATGVKTYTCTVCKKTKTQTIPKCDKYTNPIKASGKTVSVKASDVKKKNVTIAQSKAFSVSNAQGKVTYTKSSGNSKITVSSAGKITVKKGLKKGTYKVSIKVKAAGNSTYKSATKTVTVTIKIK